jgi:hypothetical protein
VMAGEVVLKFLTEVGGRIASPIEIMRQGVRKWNDYKNKNDNNNNKACVCRSTEYFYTSWYSMTAASFGPGNDSATLGTFPPADLRDTMTRGWNGVVWLEKVKGEPWVGLEGRSEVKRL